MANTDHVSYYLGFAYISLSQGQPYGLSGSLFPPPPLPTHTNINTDTHTHAHTSGRKFSGVSIRNKDIPEGMTA